MNVRKFALLFVAIVFFIVKPLPASGMEFFEGASWNLFPVPIVKVSPAEGPTFGLMPVVVSSGEEGELKTIIALAGTYNEITGGGAFLVFYLYPDPDTFFSFFSEVTRFFSREVSVHYRHTPREKGSFLYGGEFSYLQSPFERFFGFGPATQKGHETNFVSEVISTEANGGYIPFEFFSVRAFLRFERWLLHPRALLSVSDLQTTFVGNREVVASDQFLQRVEIAYDSHEHPMFGLHGERFSLASVTSSQALGSDFSFYGYDAQTKFTRSFFDGRLTTVVNGLLDQRFGGTIPFYHQSFLGGEETLRSYVKRRFTARHRWSVDLEERIEVYQRTLFDTKVALSLDPFFSLGQVFNDFSEIEWKQLQPVGGIGIRMKALPSVVGRLDFGFGREGMEIYATIDYPF